MFRHCHHAPNFLRYCFFFTVVRFEKSGLFFLGSIWLKSDISGKELLLFQQQTINFSGITFGQGFQKYDGFGHFVFGQFCVAVG